MPDAPVSRPPYHVLTFGVGMLAVVSFVGTFLLVVQMEAVAPGSGTVSARGLHEARARLEGLVQPGWFEAVVHRADGSPLAVRLDAMGNGLTDPADGPSQPVQAYEVLLGTNRPHLPRESVRFHRLEAGDLLWPGQPLATVEADDLRFRVEQLDLRLRPGESSSVLTPEREAWRMERDRLRHQLSRAVMHAPATADRWLAVQVLAAPDQAVKPGDAVATLVPVDADTGRPRELLVHLNVDEKHAGDLAVGQEVRLSSTFHRDGRQVRVLGRIERIEPQIGAAPNDRRQLRMLVAVSDPTAGLLLGASCKAEVVVGRKLVYRIILEH